MDIGCNFHFLVCLDFLYGTCPDKKETLNYPVLKAKLAKEGNAGKDVGLLTL